MISKNQPIIKLCLVAAVFLYGCPAEQATLDLSQVNYTSKGVSSFWKNATVYFLLTDRFNNGTTENDLQYDRKPDGAVLRNFVGGDIAGITQKIEAGYFDSLGVNAIWFTPVFRQNRSHTDEGTGKTYAYHGYWTQDWTALDPNFGTEEDLQKMVSTAHAHGIRILLDAVINHTGPVTDLDTQWPADWVRVTPTCQFEDFRSTVECTLVDNLPDIKTEYTMEVEIPDQLKTKWQEEGRLKEEMTSLKTFFRETGYPRYPFFYIVKWLVDWVHKLGIDGFRIDTAKHTEGYVWSILKKECEKALDAWREEHPDLTIHHDPFYMVGEVYNYGISNGRNYSYGDTTVDFYSHGFESLINFEFKYDAKNTYDSIFTKYSKLLNNPSFRDISVLNYLNSHDDGDPFDKERNRTIESANKLLLSAGAAQIYYGDEIARPLQIEGAKGDANLRSTMNWDRLESDSTTKALLWHWQRIGQFRKKHLAIGAGKHEILNPDPYTFKRTLDDNSDLVLVGLDYPAGNKSVSVNGIFSEGTVVRDFYSGQTTTVQNGKVNLNTEYSILLLEIMQ